MKVVEILKQNSNDVTIQDIFSKEIDTVKLEQLKKRIKQS